MYTGNLTPRTNTTIEAIRFTGSFGHPDGFGSVLEAAVKEDGRLVLTLSWKTYPDPTVRIWTVELDNAQRGVLAKLTAAYQPMLYECIPHDEL